jgi:hypothetical protein
VSVREPYQPTAEEKLMAIMPIDMLIFYMNHVYKPKNTEEPVSGFTPKELDRIANMTPEEVSEMCNKPIATKRKVVIVIAGKKQSGKNTLANYIAADYINRTRSASKFSVHNGELIQHAGDSYWQRSIETGVAAEEQIKWSGIRSLAFATPLKQFCHTVLGLTKDQCWGSDFYKQTLTDVKWDGLPFRVRCRYSKAQVLPRWMMPRSGFMTAREVMQVFGTDIIRDWHPNAWVDAGYRAAVGCDEVVVAITDARFENEVTAADDWSNPLPSGFKRHRDPPIVLKILLTRGKAGDGHRSETSLDSINRDLFSIVVPSTLSAIETLEYVRPVLNNVYERAKTFDPKAVK